MECNKGIWNSFCEFVSNPESLALLCYFILVLAIGVYFYFKSLKSGGSEKEYFLGGREMNGWVSALSAGASDMSAWVLMGLPGAIYLAGMGQVWIAVGLWLGTLGAWIFVAPVLRRYSIAADDAITLPQFLTKRFCTENKAIMVISALVFVITYCVYTAASLSACGTLFNTVLGVDPTQAMIVASIVIVIYTFLGGFNAVCWTDFFQGMLMLGALMLIPILAVVMMNSSEFVQPAATIPADYYNMLSSGKADWKSISEILSGLGWGLGYFGMPHILIRYFSIKNEKEMRKSRIIGCTWLTLILLATTMVGLVGRKFIGDKLTPEFGGNKELVFIEMVRNVFNWIGDNIGLMSLALFCAGLLLSAILAAAMSTADSQLLASASAFASDLYKPIFRKNASEREMLWAGRLVVVVIAVAAFFIASSPSCKGLMALVSCAWGAFGAAFGPVVILALYWRRMTYSGALAGIIAGFVVDALWYAFMGSTGIYEIIPGFLAGLIAAVVVSLISKRPSVNVLMLFEKSRQKTED